MNKKNKLAYTLGIIALFASAILIYFFNISKWNSTPNQTIKQDPQIKILQLNPIGKNADDTTIKNVEIDKKVSNKFGSKKSAYRVKKAEYTQKDLKQIASCLNTKIEEINQNANTQSCNLYNEGVLMYYNNSGSITYISNDNTTQDISKQHELNKQKCIKVAEDFVKDSNIIDFSCLVLSDVQVGYTIETTTGESPLTYQITFMKKTPQGVDGFAGIGPGIRIDVNSKYEISSFTCINKEIVELEDKYDTLTLNEAEEKIEKNQELQLITNADNIKNNILTDVSIDDVEVRLYCDSVNLKQQYMAPYYVLTGKDKSGAEVSLTMPAISDSEIQVKEIE